MLNAIVRKGEAPYVGEASFRQIVSFVKLVLYGGLRLIIEDFVGVNFRNDIIILKTK